MKIKIDNIKPNMIEMTNPCVDDLDILGILDQEIEIVDTIISADTDRMEEFPSSKKFRAKNFTDKIGKLRDSGLRLERLQSQLMRLTESSLSHSPSAQFVIPKVEPIDEFAPGFLFSDDISSSQSDSGPVTLAERKTPKRKLYAEDSEPKELPETRKRVRQSICDTECLNSTPRFYCGSCECGLANVSTRRSLDSVGSPRIPKDPLQRELYNSCDECRRRKAEDMSSKQRKYFQMLKDRRAETEKYKGQKFPCDKCHYVAAIPSNLRSHQMANHPTSISCDSSRKPSNQCEEEDLVKGSPTN